jgi:hypothetical protein
MAINTKDITQLQVNLIPRKRLNYLPGKRENLPISPDGSGTG